ncbi:MAG: MerR family transcriptional regulator [Prevotellaceae bacterium]|jgi:DNA-binding transcriptional MerR regulator|nr:MerR family transcriptional regulator [Prevotellaceae bacterium]
MAKKELKKYYSIGEVAHLFNLTEPTLRYWEREFPQLAPKRGGRSVRFYTKEDIDLIGLIHHLVKEQGMTIAGARMRLKDRREETERLYDTLQRLRAVREKLMAMKQALDGITLPPASPV